MRLFHFLHGQRQGRAADIVQSYLWYSLSTAQGDQTAAKNLKIMAAHMKDQIAEGERLARDWKPKP